MQKLSKRMIVSCGIVIVRKSKKKGHKYLLLRSNDYWDFPKGKMEPNEKPLETALREVAEETTLQPEDLKFKWGNISKQSDKYKKGRKFVIYFLAESGKRKITLPVNDEIGRPEHDEYKWMTYEEASEVLVPRVKKILDWAKDKVESY